MDENKEQTERWLTMLTEVETELGGHGRRAGVRPRQAMFLAHYEQTFNMSAAATIAGVGRQQVHRWRTEDLTFHRCWTEAQETVRDAVVAEVYERGMRGIEVALRDHRGRIVGTERRPSDRLLVATARALDDRFRDSPRPVAPPRDTSWRADLHKILADPGARAHLDALADRMPNQ
jgi:hypothetical protein